MAVTVKTTDNNMALPDDDITDSADIYSIEWANRTHGIIDRMRMSLKNMRQHLTKVMDTLNPTTHIPAVLMLRNDNGSVARHRWEVKAQQTGTYTPIALESQISFIPEAKATIDTEEAVRESIAHNMCCEDTVVFISQNPSNQARHGTAIGIAKEWIATSRAYRVRHDLRHSRDRLLLERRGEIPDTYNDIDEDDSHPSTYRTGVDGRYVEITFWDECSIEPRRRLICIYSRYIGSETASDRMPTALYQDNTLMQFIQAQPPTIFLCIAGDLNRVPNPCTGAWMSKKPRDTKNKTDMDQWVSEVRARSVPGLSIGESDSIMEILTAVTDSATLLGKLRKLSSGGWHPEHQEILLAAIDYMMFNIRGSHCVTCTAEFTVEIGTKTGARIIHTITRPIAEGSDHARRETGCIYPLSPYTEDGTTVEMASKLGIRCPSSWSSPRWGDRMHNMHYPEVLPAIGKGWYKTLPSCLPSNSGNRRRDIRLSDHMKRAIIQGIIGAATYEQQQIMRALALNLSDHTSHQATIFRVKVTSKTVFMEGVARGLWPHEGSDYAAHSMVDITKQLLYTESAIMEHAVKQMIQSISRIVTSRAVLSAIISDTEPGDIWASSTEKWMLLSRIVEHHELVWDSISKIPALTMADFADCTNKLLLSGDHIVHTITTHTSNEANALPIKEPDTGQTRHDCAVDSGCNTVRTTKCRHVMCRRLYGRFILSHATLCLDRDISTEELHNILMDTTAHAASGAVCSHSIRTGCWSYHYHTRVRELYRSMGVTGVIQAVQSPVTTCIHCKPSILASGRSECVYCDIVASILTDYIAWAHWLKRQVLRYHKYTALRTHTRDDIIPKEYLRARAMKLDSVYRIMPVLIQIRHASCPAVAHMTARRGVYRQGVDILPDKHNPGYHYIQRNSDILAERRSPFMKQHNKIGLGSHSSPFPKQCDFGIRRGDGRLHPSLMHDNWHHIVGSYRRLWYPRHADTTIWLSLHNTSTTTNNEGLGDTERRSSPWTSFIESAITDVSEATQISTPEIATTHIVCNAWFHVMMRRGRDYTITLDTHKGKTSDTPIYQRLMNTPEGMGVNMPHWIHQHARTPSMWHSIYKSPGLHHDLVTEWQAEISNMSQMMHKTTGKDKPRTCTWATGEDPLSSSLGSNFPDDSSSFLRKHAIPLAECRCQRGSSNVEHFKELSCVACGVSGSRLISPGDKNILRSHTRDNLFNKTRDWSHHLNRFVETAYRLPHDKYPEAWMLLQSRREQQDYAHDYVIDLPDTRVSRTSLVKRILKTLCRHSHAFCEHFNIEADDDTTQSSMNTTDPEVNMSLCGPGTSGTDTMISNEHTEAVDPLCIPGTVSSTAGDTPVCTHPQPLSAYTQPLSAHNALYTPNSSTRVTITGSGTETSKSTETVTTTATATTTTTTRVIEHQRSWEYSHLVDKENQNPSHMNPKYALVPMVYEPKYKAHETLKQRRRSATWLALGEQGDKRVSTEQHRGSVSWMGVITGLEVNYFKTRTASEQQLITDTLGKILTRRLAIPRLKSGVVVPDIDDIYNIRDNDYIDVDSFEHTRVQVTLQDTFEVMDGSLKGATAWTYRAELIDPPVTAAYLGDSIIGCLHNLDGGTSIDNSRSDVMALMDAVQTSMSGTDSTRARRMLKSLTRAFRTPSKDMGIYALGHATSAKHDTVSVDQLTKAIIAMDVKRPPLLWVSGQKGKLLHNISGKSETTHHIRRPNGKFVQMHADSVRDYWEQSSTSPKHDNCLSTEDTVALYTLCDANTDIYTKTLDDLKAYTNELTERDGSVNICPTDTDTHDAMIRGECKRYEDDWKSYKQRTYQRRERDQCQDDLGILDLHAYARLRIAAMRQLRNGHRTTPLRVKVVIGPPEGVPGERYVFTAIIDTGASLTLCSPEVADIIHKISGASFIPLTGQDVPRCHGAYGGSNQATGLAAFDITLHDKRGAEALGSINTGSPDAVTSTHGYIKHEGSVTRSAMAWCFPELTAPLILGIDWLRENRCIIDPASDTLFLDKVLTGDDVMHHISEPDRFPDKDTLLTVGTTPTIATFDSQGAGREPTTNILITTTSLVTIPPKTEGYISACAHWGRLEDRGTSRIVHVGDRSLESKQYHMKGESVAPTDSPHAWRNHSNDELSSDRQGYLIMAADGGGLRAGSASVLCHEQIIPAKAINDNSIRLKVYNTSTYPLTLHPMVACGHIALGEDQPLTDEDIQKVTNIDGMSTDDIDTAREIATVIGGASMMAMGNGKEHARSAMLSDLDLARFSMCTHSEDFTDAHDETLKGSDESKCTVCSNMRRAKAELIVDARAYVYRSILHMMHELGSSKKAALRMLTILTSGLQTRRHLYYPVCAGLRLEIENLLEKAVEGEWLTAGREFISTRIDTTDGPHASYSIVAHFRRELAHCHTILKRQQQTAHEQRLHTNIVDGWCPVPIATYSPQASHGIELLCLEDTNSTDMQQEVDVNMNLPWRELLADTTNRSYMTPDHRYIYGDMNETARAQNLNIILKAMPQRRCLVKGAYHVCNGWIRDIGSLPSTNEHHQLAMDTIQRAVTDGCASVDKTRCDQFWQKLRESVIPPDPDSSTPSGAGVFVNSDSGPDDYQTSCANPAFYIPALSNVLQQETTEELSEIPAVLTTQIHPGYHNKRLHTTLTDARQALTTSVHQNKQQLYDAMCGTDTRVQDMAYAALVESIAGMQMYYTLPNENTYPCSEEGACVANIADTNLEHKGNAEAGVAKLPAGIMLDSDDIAPSMQKYFTRDEYGVLRHTDELVDEVARRWGVVNDEVMPHQHPEPEPEQQQKSDDTQTDQPEQCEILHEPADTGSSPTEPKPWWWDMMEPTMLTTLNRVFDDHRAIHTDAIADPRASAATRDDIISQLKKIELPHIDEITDEHDREALKGFVHMMFENAPAFYVNPEFMGAIKGFSMAPGFMQLVGSKVFSEPPRGIPMAAQESIQQYLTDLARRGIIEKSHSPWSNSVFLVRKKGLDPFAPPRWRMVLDARGLNSLVAVVRWPMPPIHEILAAIGGKDWISVSDISDGFWALNLPRSLRPVTAFSACGTKWQWCRMIQGGVNSMQALSYCMSAILGDLQNKCCKGSEHATSNAHTSCALRVYADDLALSSMGSLADHLIDCTCVIKRLRRYGVCVSAKKTHLAQKWITLLGYDVSSNGIHMSKDKISTLLECDRPETRSALHSFNGLVSFYRRFCPQLAGIAKSFNPLLKKDAPERITDEVWRESGAMDAFHHIRNIVIRQTTLAVPELGENMRPMGVISDASNHQIGGCAYQEQVIATTPDGRNIVAERPLGYFSRVLTDPESRWSASERELLAVTATIRAFKYITYATSCSIITDHACLAYCLKPTVFSKEGSSTRLYNLALEIQGLGCIVIHRRGVLIPHADWASRSKDIPEQMRNRKRAGPATLDPTLEDTEREVRLEKEHADDAISRVSLLREVPYIEGTQLSPYTDEATQRAREFVERYDITAKGRPTHPVDKQEPTHAERTTEEYMTMADTMRDQGFDLAEFGSVRTPQYEPVYDKTGNKILQQGAIAIFEGNQTHGIPYEERSIPRIFERLHGKPPDDIDRDSFINTTDTIDINSSSETADRFTNNYDSYGEPMCGQTQQPIDPQQTAHVTPTGQRCTSSKRVAEYQYPPTLYSSAAGVGGFTQGAVTAGYKVIGGNEASAMARESFIRKFCINIGVDSNKVDEAALYGAWLLEAGSSCKAVAPSGLRRGADDDRMKLYINAPEIAVRVQVPVVTLEQLPEALRERAGRLKPGSAKFKGCNTLEDVVVRKFRAASYICDTYVFDGADFGGHVVRPRIFTIAVRADIMAMINPGSDVLPSEDTWPSAFIKTSMGLEHPNRHTYASIPVKDVCHSRYCHDGMPWRDSRNGLVLPGRIARNDSARCVQIALEQSGLPDIPSHYHMRPGDIEMYVDDVWHRPDGVIQLMRRRNEPTIGDATLPTHIYSGRGMARSPTGEGNTGWYLLTIKGVVVITRLPPLHMAYLMGIDVSAFADYLTERELYSVIGQAVMPCVSKAITSALYTFWHPLVFAGIIRSCPHRRAWLTPTAYPSDMVTHQATPSHVNMTDTARCSTSWDRVRCGLSTHITASLYMYNHHTMGDVVNRIATLVDLQSNDVHISLDPTHNSKTTPAQLDLSDDLATPLSEIPYMTSPTRRWNRMRTRRHQFKEWWAYLAHRTRHHTYKHTMNNGQPCSMQLVLLFCISTATLHHYPSPPSLLDHTLRLTAHIKRKIYLPVTIHTVHCGSNPDVHGTNHSKRMIGVVVRNRADHLSRILGVKDKLTESQRTPYEIVHRLLHTAKGQVNASPDNRDTIDRIVANNLPPRMHKQWERWRTQYHQKELRRRSMHHASSRLYTHPVNGWCPMPIHALTSSWGKHVSEREIPYSVYLTEQMGRRSSSLRGFIRKQPRGHPQRQLMNEAHNTKHSRLLGLHNQRRDKAKDRSEGHGTEWRNKVTSWVMHGLAPWCSDTRSPALDSIRNACRMNTHGDWALTLHSLGASIFQPHTMADSLVLKDIEYGLNGRLSTPSLLTQDISHIIRDVSQPTDQAMDDHTCISLFQGTAPAHNDTHKSLDAWIDILDGMTGPCHLMTDGHTPTGPIDSHMDPDMDDIIRRWCVIKQRTQAYKSHTESTLPSDNGPEQIGTLKDLVHDINAVATDISNIQCKVYTRAMVASMTARAAAACDDGNPYGLNSALIIMSECMTATDMYSSAMYKALHDPTSTDIDRQPSDTPPASPDILDTVTDKDLNVTGTDVLTSAIAPPIVDKESEPSPDELLDSIMMTRGYTLGNRAHIVMTDQKGIEHNIDAWAVVGATTYAKARSLMKGGSGGLQRLCIITRYHAEDGSDIYAIVLDGGGIFHNSKGLKAKTLIRWLSLIGACYASDETGMIRTCRSISGTDAIKRSWTAMKDDMIHRTGTTLVKPGPVKDLYAKGELQCHSEEFGNRKFQLLCMTAKGGYSDHNTRIRRGSYIIYPPDCDTSKFNVDTPLPDDTVALWTYLADGKDSILPTKPMELKPPTPLHNETDSDEESISASADKPMDDTTDKSEELSAYEHAMELERRAAETWVALLKARGTTRMLRAKTDKPWPMLVSKPIHKGLKKQKVVTKDPTGSLIQQNQHIFAPAARDHIQQAQRECVELRYLYTICERSAGHRVPANPGKPDKETEFPNALMMEYMRDQFGNFKNYTIIEGVLYRRQKQTGKGKAGDTDLTLVVPISMRTSIMAMAHETHLTSHVGINPMVDKLSKNFWWSTLERDVEWYVQSCTVCAKTKRTHSSQEPLRHVVEVPPPFHTVQVDILGPLGPPESAVKGKEGSPPNMRYVLSITDEFDKFVWLYPMASNRSQDTMEGLLDFTLKTCIFPSVIKTAHDVSLISKACERLNWQLGIHHKMVSAWSPRVIGQVERGNSTIYGRLIAMIGADQTKWAEMISFVQYAINNTPHRATRCTPISLRYGMDTRGPLEVALAPTPPNVSDAMRFTHEKLIRMRDMQHECTAYVNDYKAKAVMECEDNVSKVTFEKGDMCWVHMPTAPVEVAKKLNFRYHGPYKVLDISRKAFDKYGIEIYPDHITYVKIDRLKPYKGRSEMELLSPLSKDEYVYKTTPEAGGVTDPLVSAVLLVRDLEDDEILRDIASHLQMYRSPDDYTDTYIQHGILRDIVGEWQRRYDNTTSAARWSHRLHSIHSMREGIENDKPSHNDGTWGFIWGMFEHPRYVAKEGERIARPNKSEPRESKEGNDDSPTEESDIWVYEKHKEIR